jgi:hypothetical protein
VSLAYVYRNLVYKPVNMRQTPTMALGITDHLWSLEPSRLAPFRLPEAVFLAGVGGTRPSTDGA